jgi:hypothetical protein
MDTKDIPPQVKIPLVGHDMGGDPDERSPLQRAVDTVADELENALLQREGRRNFPLDLRDQVKVALERLKRLSQTIES